MDSGTRYNKQPSMGVRELIVAKYEIFRSENSLKENLIYKYNITIDNVRIYILFPLMKRKKILCTDFTVLSLCFSFL